MQAGEVGIVIVTHNSGDLVGACLDSCRGVADVVVVDNASSDHTVEEARRGGVRVIANARNVGFAAATNQGIASLDAPFLLLLNPDARLEGGLDALVDCLQQEGVGAVGGKLVDDAGQPQTGFMVRRLPTAAALACEVLGLNRIWPGNPVNRAYRCLAHDPDIGAEVEQPAGAFLMLRREAWESLGGFDESFAPLWFEDVDFCRRLTRNGWRILYEPAAVAQHVGGHSIRKMDWPTRTIAWYVSLLRYASKHFTPAGRRGVASAVCFGSVLRAIAGICRGRGFRPIGVSGRVIRLALGCLVSGRIGESGAASPRLLAKEHAQR